MKQVETAVLVISDVHIGKKTPKYDTRKAARVLESVAVKVQNIAQLLKNDYGFDEFVVIMLGDILDGSEIFPGQAAVQDIPNVLAQAVAAAHLFLPIIEAGVSVAGKVRICGVAGNHGRSGKNAAEAANWDIVCYQQLESLCKAIYKDKVTFEINAPRIEKNSVKENDLFWMKLVRVKNHYFLLHHGHRARNVLGVPFYGIRQRALTWRSAFPQRWKVLLHGHFHTFARMDFNDIIVLLNGTSVMHDTWALENFGMASVNRWWFFGVSNKFPITWSFGLDLNFGD